MIGWLLNALRGVLQPDRHLPGCTQFQVQFVGRAGGVGRGWDCAPGCPIDARRRRQCRRAIETWTGHR